MMDCEPGHGTQAPTLITDKRSCIWWPSRLLKVGSRSSKVLTVRKRGKVVLEIQLEPGTDALSHVLERVLQH